MDNVRRPWQGTLLGIFYILVGVLLGLALIFLTLAVINGGMEALTQKVETDSSFILFFQSLNIPISLVTLICFVLEIIIVKGFFTGTKWVVIFSLILMAYSLISSLISLEIIYIIVYSFLTWANIICLKHPFYKKIN
jgi:hypothetical protein